ncbi:MAG: flagellar export chaperone FliS [Treponema sp.]|nr:flagellar export chaperone FliS [Treponema sp.]
MANNNALTAYKETTVKTASQGQLIIMLYDGAVKQLNRALELIKLNTTNKKDPGRIEQISKAIMKTEEIITELTVSLDFEKGGEISKGLFAIYTWFNRELLEANIDQDASRLTAVRDLLLELRGVWNEIMNQYNAENKNREVTGLNIAG